MNNLPEKDVYINLLKAAGFSDIQVGLTKSFYLSNSEFTQPDGKGKKSAIRWPRLNLRLNRRFCKRPGNINVK